MPMACISAYIVVGPTKVQPRFFKAFDKRTDAGDVGLPVQYAMSLSLIHI